MTWFWLALFAAFFFAISNVAEKFLLLHFVNSPERAARIAAFFSIIVAVGILVADSSVVSVPLSVIGIAVSAGLFELWYIYYYLKAIEKEDVAYLIPLFSLSPILVLVLSALFFNDPIHLSSVLGIVTIIIGVCLLVISKEGMASVKSNRPFWFLCVAAALYSVDAILFDHSVGTAGLLAVMFWSRLGVVIGAVIVTALTRSWADFSSFRQLGPYTFCITEAFNLFTLYLMLGAYRQGPVAYVAGIENIQPLFVFGMSYILARFFPRALGEQFAFRSMPLAISSIIVIAGGALLIHGF